MDETIVLDIERMRQQAGTLHAINVDYDQVSRRLDRINAELPNLPGAVTGQVDGTLRAVRAAVAAVVNELDTIATDLERRAELAERSQLPQRPSGRGAAMTPSPPEPGSIIDPVPEPGPVGIYDPVPEPEPIGIYDPVPEPGPVGIYDPVPPAPPTTVISSPNPTLPTGPIGGAPTGRPHVLWPGMEKDWREVRGLDRENDSANILARLGYHVQQQPTPAELAAAAAASGDSVDPLRNADYIIEGRVFDGMAPDTGKSVRNIWSEAREKVEEGQTQRVVINLADWDGDLAELQDQFDEWPIPGLKEVKVIERDETVVQVV